MAKTHTSNEVKKRWMDKAYRKYTISLRYDTDQHIIDFVEGNKEKYGTTNIFREALDRYVKSGELDD